MCKPRTAFFARHLGLSLLSVAAILSASLSAQAEAPIAPMTTHGNYIAWHPTGAYTGINLRIADPNGRVSDRSFAGPGPITISTSTMDGVYQYELVFTPKVPPGQLDAMKQHRAGNPGEPFSGGVRGGAQSGAFTVVSGSVVDTTLSE